MGLASTALEMQDRAIAAEARAEAAEKRVAVLEEENDALSAGHEEVVDADRDYLRGRVEHLEATLERIAKESGPYFRAIIEVALKGKSAK